MSVAVAIGQLVLFVAISVLPFLGLQLNGAWYMALPLVIAGTLAFLSIGLLVGSIAKTAEGGSGLANLITLPMAFLSGAFIPLESAPQWLETASKFLPMGYLVEGMKDVMVRGEGPSAAFMPIADPARLRRGGHLHRDQGVPLGHRLTVARWQPTDDGAALVRRSRRPPAGPW